MKVFQAICTFNRTAPPFLKIVTVFGRKLSSGDEDYNTMSIQPAVRAVSRFSRKGTDQGRCLDLCYNIRHFERHGRELEDPWSCRQSTVHQNYWFDTRVSSWVVIQPPISFDSGLRADKTGENGPPDGFAYPISHRGYRRLEGVPQLRLGQITRVCKSDVASPQRTEFPGCLARFVSAWLVITWPNVASRIWKSHSVNLMANSESASRLSS